MTGMRQNVPPTKVNNDWTPDSMLTLYFAAVVVVVVEEINQNMY
jgi:hypothetical protein